MRFGTLTGGLSRIQSHHGCLAVVGGLENFKPFSRLIYMGNLHSHLSYAAPMEVAFPKTTGDQPELFGFPAK
jgi:hypothetical protein